MDRKTKTKYFAIGILVLAGCVTTHKISRNGTKEQRQLSQQGASEATEEQAKDLHSFLQQRMGEDRIKEIRDSCEKGAPLFHCFTFINRERLEARAETAKQMSRPSRHLIKAVLPKIKNSKIVNWMDLRFAQVSALLRGVGSANSGQLEVLKTAALSEKNCPNNIAVAVAATLEDGLPNPALVPTIATLYEKGANCLGSFPLDQETLWTRAGLFYFWHRDYVKSSQVFEKASLIAGSYAGRSLYWLSKSYQERKLSRDSEKALETLRSRYPFSFHSLVGWLANKEDPGKVLEKSFPLQAARSGNTPGLNSLLEQVEVLKRFGFDPSASLVLEWASVISEGSEPEVRVYIAELKKDEGDYQSKISILSDVLYHNPSLISRETMELYFPKVFFPIFESNSQGLDPYLLLAIARRESAFNPKAVSSAKAKGLLQLLPSTANRISENPNLEDPETNVTVGAKFLQGLMGRLDGRIYLALAAYNAGPERLRIWTDRYLTDDPILFIDLIPYRETREYVASVLRNYYWYRRLHVTSENQIAHELIPHKAQP